MALSAEQKKKIEEEETYRVEVKGNLKKKKGIGCLGWIVIFSVSGIVLPAMFSSINPTGQLEKVRQNKSQVVNNQYAFDVPFLVGKDLYGVIAVLGTPEGNEPTRQQIDLGIKEWDKTFRNNGQELLVTYTISDKKIVDFFISTNDPSGITTDTNALLQQGNLTQNDPRYRVEFVKAIKNTNTFTGVKVIPKSIMK